MTIFGIYLSYQLIIIFIVLSIITCFSIAIWFFEQKQNKQLKKQIEYNKAREEGRVERINHPYFCEKCNFDLIGSVSSSNYSCPECGHQHTTWTKIDALVAQALLKHQRVPSKYLAFHVYGKAKDSNPPVYFYKQTILAINQQIAQKAAIELQGEHAIAIQTQSTSTTNQAKFVPYSLTIAQSYSALAMIDEFDKLSINEMAK